MSTTPSSAPVTVLVSRRVRRGQSAQFEQLMAGMQAAAAKFPGHVGGYLIHPQDTEEGSYHTLFAFDTQAHLQAWTNSAERKAWLQRIAPLTHGDAALRVLTGLETWFALPAARTKTPPPRWKMALVTWLGIFPLVLLLSRTVGAALSPFAASEIVAMVVTALVVVAMTWFVMPTLARLFAGWLYPPGSEPETKPTPAAE